jgi:cytochrome c oxidase subunit 1
MHGTTMMFLFAVPVMSGMALYLIPLMLGTREFAFPRLNALGYWLYLAGGLFIYAGFALHAGADAGWFAYTPLSGPTFSPGKRSDIWAQMITFTEIASIIVAVEVIVAFLKLRAPGMSLSRIPLFGWAMFVQSWMVLLAMPTVMIATTLLISDRSIGTHFFNPAENGEPLLWQHLFWFFGHPEVYLIFIPALGMLSHLISAATHRPIFGYPAMVLSLVTTAFFAFGLWVHHMFTTGLPQIGETFFTAASLIIAIPTGVQIFCWIATLWGARIRMNTAFLFALGFFSTFIIGGLTGVMIASVPFDQQVHDTYFIVAHFHYTLIGGAVFPLLGAVYHWFPKITGRLLDERLGKWNFAFIFAGFHLTFFPLHIAGMMGMPRRVYTYPPGLGWDIYHQLATIGALLLLVGGILFLINVFRSVRLGARAGQNPWAADSLEWSTDGPPPAYSFMHQPIVHSRSPMWEPSLGEVTGVASSYREVLVTTAKEAAPHHRMALPAPSIWPLITGCLTTAGLIASVFYPETVYFGAALVLVSLLGWFWPRGSRYDPVRVR